MFGMFDKIFDFNHDGKLDGFEKAAKFATFASMYDEWNRDTSGLDDDFDEDEFDEFDDGFDDDFI